MRGRFRGRCRYDVGRDGTIGSGGRKCREISNGSDLVTGLSKLEAQTRYHQKSAIFTAALSHYSYNRIPQERKPSNLRVHR